MQSLENYQHPKDIMATKGMIRIIEEETLWLQKQQSVTQVEGYRSIYPCLQQQLLAFFALGYKTPFEAEHNYRSSLTISLIFEGQNKYKRAYQKISIGKGDPK